MNPECFVNPDFKWQQWPTRVGVYKLLIQANAFNFRVQYPYYEGGSTYYIDGIVAFVRTDIAPTGVPAHGTYSLLDENQQVLWTGVINTQNIYSALLYDFAVCNCVCKHGNYTTDGCGGQIGDNCWIVGPEIASSSSTIV